MAATLLATAAVLFVTAVVKPLVSFESELSDDDKFDELLAEAAVPFAFEIDEKL